MGKLRQAGMKYVYERVIEEGGGSECLLDFQNYLANVSRLPLWCHELPEGSPNLQDLLEGIAEFSRTYLSDGQEEVFGKGQGNEGGGMIPLSKESLRLFNVLLAAILIRIPGTAPIRLAEFGATDGILSCHIAAMLAAFHPDNALCCITDKIGNESGNQWLPRISLLPALPGRLSLLTGDYEDSNLQAGHFDIVVVNGSELFPKPAETVQEAVRVLKEGGKMLLLHGGQEVLMEVFLRIFPKGKAYAVQDGWGVFVSDAT